MHAARRRHSIRCEMQVHEDITAEDLREIGSIESHALDTMLCNSAESYIPTCGVSFCWCSEIAIHAATVSKPCRVLRGSGMLVPSMETNLLLCPSPVPTLSDMVCEGWEDDVDELKLFTQDSVSSRL